MLPKVIGKSSGTEQYAVTLTFNTRPWYLVPMLDPLSFSLPLHYVVNKACQALLSGSEAKVHMMIHVPTQELFPSPPS